MDNFLTNDEGWSAPSSLLTCRCHEWSCLCWSNCRSSRFRERSVLLSCWSLNHSQLCGSLSPVRLALQPPFTSLDSNTSTQVSYWGLRESICKKPLLLTMCLRIDLTLALRPPSQYLLVLTLFSYLLCSPSLLMQRLLVHLTSCIALNQRFF